MTMQSRRSSSSGIPSLSLVLPHPPLPTRRSSGHSSSRLSHESYSSPRTPRSSSSLSASFPAQTFFRLDANAPARSSTDSWHSRGSSFDGCDDDMEWEWQPDQIALLEKTLEAIPAHLLSPFYGAVPPSNLLDKLAHSVTSSKSSHEWPHSSRATRVKLLELARDHAYENGELRRRHVYDIPEDDNTDDSDDALGLRLPGGKRKLQRQSSMDFMMQNSGVASLKESSIGRLSARLQRADRIISNPAYSPPPITRRPFSLGDSPDIANPTSTTEASANVKPRTSASSLTTSRIHGPRLKRSTTLIASSMPSIQDELAKGTSTAITVPSSAPTSSASPLAVMAAAGMGINPGSVISGRSASATQTQLHSQSHATTTRIPRPQMSKIRRSESFSSPGMSGLGHSLKRAPSFGASSIRSCESAVSSAKMSVDERSVGSVVDGDEKENVRVARARRPRGIVNVVVVEQVPVTNVDASASSAATSATMDVDPSKEKEKSRKLEKLHKSDMSYVSEERLDVYPSSDEEEKKRSRRAKKARTKSPEPASPTAKSSTGSGLSASSKSSSNKSKQSSSSNSSSSKSNSNSSSSSSEEGSGSTPATSTSVTPTPSPPNTLRKKEKSRPKHIRNSSMFGDELPNPQREPEVPKDIPPSNVLASVSAKLRAHQQQQEEMIAHSIANNNGTPITPPSPTQTRRSLRRVGTFNFPFSQRPPRKMSFGSSARDSVNTSRLDNIMGELLDLTPTEERPTLGSAFQLN